MPKILALCGGVGGAKLAYGLAQVMAPQDVAFVVNVGDDFEHLGLLVCPDLDTVTYTLAGADNREQGWGRADESWSVMAELERLGGEAWFRLGDKDIALHLLRRGLLGSGMGLTAATAAITARFGVGPAVLPVSDDPIRTMVATSEGELEFQQYFVGRRCEPTATGFRFAGIEQARLSPAVLAALEDPALEGVIVCPSNPFVSIEPIVAVQDLRARLAATGVPVLAVSPIIGGKAVKGPAAKMMAELDLEVSALSVASLYAGWIDAMVADERDGALPSHTPEGVRLFSAQTLMSGPQERVALARDCLRLLKETTSRPRR